MAEVFAPFIVNRTIRNLTFYVMEGRNFVRKKSSLTRRKVLYSPRFVRTRHYASLMGHASQIGSWVYNSLPDFWRQSWMYRSFTGEAFTMLKKGMEEREIKELLYNRYVQEIVDKQVTEKPSIPELNISKRSYKKRNITYWQNKTSKSSRRKELIQQRQRNAGLLAEASKIASALYSGMPPCDRNRSVYQQLTGEAMRWLKEQEKDEMAINAHEPANSLLENNYTSKRKKNVRAIGSVFFRTGMFYFIPQQKQRYLVRTNDMANRIVYSPVKKEISP